MSVTSTAHVRVLIADDHVLVAEALCKLLSQDFEIAGMVHNGRQLLETAIKFPPDVILAEIAMPVLNGLDASERIKHRLPNVKIVCVTAESEPELMDEAFRCGVDGYVLKTCAPAELVTAIRFALEGKRYVPGEHGAAESSCNATTGPDNMSHSHLTDRQLDILQLLAEGRSMKQAAGVLNLTYRTVAFHKYRAMHRLNLRNDAQMVQYALKHHIIATEIGARQ